MRLLRQGYRQDDPDFGTFAGRGMDFHLPAVHPHALPDILKSEPVVVLGIFNSEPTSIVRNDNFKSVAMVGCVHPEQRCISMANGIAHRLMHDLAYSLKNM